MKFLYKVVFYASIAFIITSILLSIILKTLPLTFSEEKNNEYFDGIFFAGIPVAILLTISKIGFRKNIQKNQIKKIILNTILLSIAVFIIFILYAFASFGTGMRDWSEGKILYQNKSNKTRIVKRHFGCGATDSSPAITKTFKATPITPLFIYFSKADTTTLDKNVWAKINE